MPGPATRIAIYGEINMNVIDGSSVWMQSVSQVVAAAGDVAVTLMLRAPVERDVLLAPLRDDPRISIVAPAARLDPPAAADELERLDAPFDAVLLRGDGIVDEVVRRGSFDGRLWLYYIPPHSSLPGSDAERLRRLAPRASRILCQTESIAERLRAAVPEAAGKLVRLPPMIPPLQDPSPDDLDGPVRALLYAGKFAPEYHFLEMLELFGRFRADRPDARLDVVGDKIHNPRDDPGFRPAAERALRETPGLVWHGGVERSRVHELLRGSDVALSLRHPRMDASLELSTKILEYGAAGRPVLLNRTSVHEALLGADYPLLATGADEALEALRRVSADPALRLEAARRCHAASRRHTFDVVAAELAPALPRAGRIVVDERPWVVVAGHDLKFLGAIGDWAGGTVRHDRWRNHTQHDEAQSRAAVEWADTVLCEWCLGNAAWYSRHKRPGQRLVVRFHRMELETPHPGKVDLGAVDDLVFVAEHVLEAALEQFGWRRSERMRVVPNAIDPAPLALGKLPGADFELGMVGFVPALKRLDRGLDVLERLRVRDPRYRLTVKGHPPWHFKWMAAREEERRYYRALYARLERAPLLRDAVSFEPFGDDVATFLQRVGYVLSTSDIEGHAVALGEGMASGAIPVVFERPGARSQYEARWVHRDADGAATWILGLAARGEAAAERERARAFAARWSPAALAPVWRELLAGGLDRAAAP